MAHPQNWRAYGVLLRRSRVLIAAEWVGPVFAWKYPGGGVDPGESAEQALVREFMEETQMAVRIVAELHDPGTRISPWTGGPYTPVYYLVEGEGEPLVPAHEKVEMAWHDPAAVLASDLVAPPEKIALRAALAR
jgi:8-oxo-dGTP diphosphatase